MVEQITLLLCLILVLGILCQWFAWWVKVPSILFLMIVGLLLGPVFGVLHPDRLFGHLLFPFVSLAVAVILFEGSLSLKFKEMETRGHVIRNLVTLGYGFTVFATMILAHFLFKFSWQLSLLFGAITSIGGPTVVAPILRSVHLPPELHKILHWESILIDSVGALITVLIFGLVSSTLGDSKLSVELIHFAAVICVGSLLGIGFGLGLGYCLRELLLPEYLTNVAALTAVILAYALTDWVDPGGGLLACSLMGITMANMRGLHIKDIVNFKESLSVLMISVLFIVLAARIEFHTQLTVILSGIMLFVLAQFVMRPISVWLCTLQSPLNWRQKVMLSWICPRGIVTASVATLFSYKLVMSGHPEAKPFVILSFVMIMSAVLFQSITTRPLAKLLKQFVENASGVVLVGANLFSIELAKICLAQGLKVLMIDTKWKQLAAARLAGIDTYYGDALAIETTDQMNMSNYGVLFALTSHHEFNVLCCLHYKPEFDRRCVHTLLSEQESDLLTDPLDNHSEKRYRRLFSPLHTLSQLEERITNGATIKATKLTQKFLLDDLKNTGDMVLLFAISSKGQVLPFTNHADLNNLVGWTVITLVAPA